MSCLFSSDIDECADGFVECDSKSTCVNLPGWYHCECRDGYHDNGLFSANGESCVGEYIYLLYMMCLYSSTLCMHLLDAI